MLSLKHSSLLDPKNAVLWLGSKRFIWPWM